jgi:prepilin-type N-terminal cleavage/methylation domain-containing protein
MKRIHKGQKGLTLLELVVALSIAALIVAAATGVIIHLLNTSEASNRMVACRQVQTAGYWISKDGVQAQRVNITAPPDFLILEWTEWEGNGSYRITYFLEDMPSGSSKQLKRIEEVNGTEGAALIIATSLVPEETSCSWTSDEKQSFAFKVTAKVGEQTETRIYEITPRPLFS